MICARDSNVQGYEFRRCETCSKILNYTARWSFPPSKCLHEFQVSLIRLDDTMRLARDVLALLLFSMFLYCSSKL
jgi:hypothetical protein